MGIEPTTGGCPATGFEDQERHQAANYSHDIVIIHCFPEMRKQEQGYCQ